MLPESHVVTCIGHECGHREIRGPPQPQQNLWHHLVPHWPRTPVTRARVQLWHIPTLIPFERVLIDVSVDHATIVTTYRIIMITPPLMTLRMRTSQPP